MDKQYVSFTSKEMEVLIKLMKLIIENDGDGYAPKLQITIIP